MQTINATNARKDLYNLIESVGINHEPVLITGKRANAVLISEEDWDTIQGLLQLDSISQYEASVLEGAKERLEKCIPENKINW